MRLKAIQKALQQAYNASTLKNSEFGPVWRNQGKPIPVTMADGSPVTENNVTDFIRERTHLYRATWVLPFIQEAMDLVSATQPHQFAPAHPGLSRCDLCGMGSVHRLHKGFKQ